MNEIVSNEKKKLEEIILKKTVESKKENKQEEEKKVKDLHSDSQAQNKPEDKTKIIAHSQSQLLDTLRLEFRKELSELKQLVLFFMHKNKHYRIQKNYNRSQDRKKRKKRKSLKGLFKQY